MKPGILSYGDLAFIEIALAVLLHEKFRLGAYALGCLGMINLMAHVLSIFVKDP